MERSVRHLHHWSQTILLDEKRPYGLWRQLLAIAAALAAMEGVYFVLVRSAKYLVGPGWFTVGVAVPGFFLSAVTLGVVVWEAVTRDRHWRTLLMTVRPGLQVVALLATTIAVIVVAAIVAASHGLIPSVPDFRILSTEAAVRIASIFLNAMREEVFYRYFLFCVFAKLARSVAAGIICATAVFVLGHAPEKALFVFSSGLCLGAIAIRSGSLWVSCATHFGINLLIELLFSSGPIASPPVLSSAAIGYFYKYAPWVAVPTAIALLRNTLLNEPVAMWLRTQLRTTPSRATET